MTCHAIFREKDIFPYRSASDNNVVFEDRFTGKVIVFDTDGNVALVGNKINDFYLLPGGGIGPNEPIETGIIRECLEEIGCKVTLLKDLGTTEDFRTRDKKHYINHCFTAQVIGEKGKLHLTEEEAKNGMHVKWVPLEEAIKILADEVEQLHQGKISFYNTGFNISRDHIFLLEAQKKKHK